MDKNTSITIRLPENLKKSFTLAVQKKNLEGLTKTKDSERYKFITTSDMIRSFIKNFCEDQSH